MRENLKKLELKPDFAECAACRLHFLFLERIEQKKDRTEMDLRTLYREASAVIRDEMRAAPVGEFLDAITGQYPGSTPDEPISP